MKKWGVVKIIGCEIPSSWYYNLVGQKIRVFINSKGEMRRSFYMDYQYFTAIHNNGLLDIKDIEV